MIPKMPKAAVVPPYADTDPKPQHVMLDLETLGRDPSCMILSIGACAFDPNTGRVHPNTFYQRVDWASQQKAGRTIDTETVRWWFEQPEAARMEIIKEGTHLGTVLMWLDTWMPSGAKVWGNGALFDVAILQHAYHTATTEGHPWEFWNVRDVRTITDLAAEAGLKRDDVPFPAGGVKHNALDDAIWQAAYVSKFWQALKGAGK